MTGEQAPALIETKERMMGTFDLDKLKQAYETKDPELMRILVAEGFEHTEMDDVTPPSNPSVKGERYLVDIMERNKDSKVQFKMGDMLDGGDMIAYNVTCILPNGRNVSANIIAHVKDGKITKQLAIEARDPEK